MYIEREGDIYIYIYINVHMHMYTPLCKICLSKCLFNTTCQTQSHHPRRDGVAE